MATNVNIWDDIDISVQVNIDPKNYMFSVQLHETITHLLLHMDKTACLPLLSSCPFIWDLILQTWRLPSQYNFENIHQKIMHLQHPENEALTHYITT